MRIFIRSFLSFCGSFGRKLEAFLIVDNLNKVLTENHEVRATSNFLRQLRRLLHGHLQELSLHSQALQHLLQLVFSRLHYMRGFLMLTFFSQQLLVLLHEKVFHFLAFLGVIEVVWFRRRSFRWPRLFLRLHPIIIKTVNCKSAQFYNF